MFCFGDCVLLILEEGSELVIDPSSTVQEEEEDEKEPELPPPTPLPFDHIQYLIIGGGTTGATAFRAIKSRDVNAKVGL